MNFNSQKQTTFVVIGALRINVILSLYTATIFMKCTHVWVAQTTYFKLFTKSYVLISPDLCLSADEIAKPSPDMNVKVATNTVTHWLNYTRLQ